MWKAPKRNVPDRSCSRNEAKRTGLFCVFADLGFYMCVCFFFTDVYRLSRRLILLWILLCWYAVTDKPPVALCSFSCRLRPVQSALYEHETNSYGNQQTNGVIYFFTKTYLQDPTIYHNRKYFGSNSPRLLPARSKSPCHVDG